MEDMTTDFYQKSDKLLAERNAGAVTYQVGEFYVMAVQGIGGSDVSLYDSNLENIKNTSYPDMENLTEVLNKFCEDFQFDGIDTLRNRSAEMLNFGTFMQNYHQAFDRRDSSLEMEGKCFQNPEDSFAIYTLNPTQHNEQLEGRSMDFLEKVGENLDKRNFQCLFADDLASLKDNDPMFYGETDMEQHFQEALAELEAGDGEKLLTMLHVKSPKMEGMENELQTGCVLALKIDGEVNHFFMEETDLIKVDFHQLPPKFKEMAVEEQKEKFYADLLDNSWEISDFTNQPLPQFDQTCITILVNSAMEMNPEANRKDILAFVGDAINEGDILPKDFRNMDISDFVVAVADLEKSQLAPFSSVEKEEQSNEALTFTDTKELVGKMQENPVIARAIREANDITVVADGLDSPLPFEDLAKINDFATDIWLKYEDVSKVEITDFIGNAIGEGVIEVSDLENISRSDFFNCLANGDTQQLGELVGNVTTVETEQTNENLTYDEVKELAQGKPLEEVVQGKGTVDFSSLTTEDLMGMLQNDSNLRHIVGETAELTKIQGYFNEELSVADLKTINHMVEMVGTRVDEHEKSQDDILLFISNAVNEGDISPSDLREMSVSDLVEVILEDDRQGLFALAQPNHEQEASISEATPRMVAGSYEITDSIVMGGEEIAVGESPSGMAGTWERSIVADEEKGVVDNWYSGHYFGTKEEAVEDFQQRIEDKLQEREAFLGDKSMYSENNPENSEKAKGKLKEGEKTPRESVLAKLKEIKEQTAKAEGKETPTKTKADQSI